MVIVPFLLLLAIVRPEGVVDIVDIWEALQNDQHLDDGIKYPFDAYVAGIKWNLVGNSMIVGDKVVLTSDTKSQSGGIWSSAPNFAKYWAVQIEFLIHNDHRGSLVGDGLAFWYVRDPWRMGGAFGYSNLYYGLGVFFDTFNNQEDSSLNFPFISASVDNMTRPYNHTNDGFLTAMGGCSREIRNHPTQALVIYDNDYLTVYVKDHDSSPYSSGGFTKCFSVPNVILPTGLFFGVSAATGDLTDNHELISVRMISLDPGDENDHQKVPGVSGEEVIGITSKESIKRGFSVALFIVIAIGALIALVVYLFVGRTPRNKLF